MYDSKNAATTATPNVENEDVNMTTQSVKSTKGEASTKKKRHDKPEDLMFQHTMVLFNKMRPALEIGEYTPKLRKCFNMAVTQKYVPKNKSEAQAKDEYAKRIYGYTSNYHFVKYCHKHGYDPYTAATHAVLFGKTTMKKALIEDIMEFGEPKFQDSKYDTQSWSEPVFQKNELPTYQKLVDMYGLPTVEPVSMQTQKLAEQAIESEADTDETSSESPNQD